jgi:HEPN domain-containing protein
MHLDEENRGISRTWLSYAESDLSLASTKPEGAILPGTLCFLAQQACEKSLKALLIYCGIQFPRTHNINVLIQHIPDSIQIPEEVFEAAKLTDYAVSSRYPGIVNLLPNLNTEWLSNQPSSFSNGFLIRL